MSVLGVDGCRSGWVAVEIGGTEGTRAGVVSSIVELPAGFPDATLVAVDMPIGLGTATFRSADSMARIELGPRRSSCFATPPRAVLETDDHATASALCVELTGKGISRQSHGLRHKILELDRWIHDAPIRVHEAHPELCFAEILGGPAENPKKTWGGIGQRIRALQEVGLDPLRLADDGVSAVAPDDLLDAFAAAWTAKRIEAGTARTIPDPPELLDSGETAAIWV